MAANPAHPDADGQEGPSTRHRQVSSKGKDPILNLLSRTPGPRIVLFLGASFLLFGLAVAAAWFEGVLRTSGGPAETEGFLDDFSTVVDFIVLDPLIVLLIVRFHDSVDQALGQPDEVLHGPNIEARRAAASRRLRLLAHPAWSLLAAGWTWVVMVLHILDRLSLGPSYAGFDGTPLTTTGSLVWLGTAVVVYLVSLGLLKGVVYSISLWQLGQVPGIRFDLTNPDGVGGARLLIRPIRIFHWFLLVCGMIVALFVAHDWYYFDNVWTFRIAISSIFYMIFFPSLFVLPLFVMHGYMAAFRRDFLKRLATRLPLPLAGAAGDAPAASVGDGISLKDWLAWRDVAQQFPVWPLSVPQVVRWAAIYYGPAVVPLVLAIIPNVRIGS